MAGNLPEERVGCPVARQEWRTMTFLHWPYERAALRPLVPAQYELDTWEGRAWVSLTPFKMAHFRLGPAPAALGMTFPETNLRTYVVDEQGRDGLWFLSLEADNLPTVLAANTVYGVPYRWADMAVEEGPTVRYVSRRRVGAPVSHDISVRPGAPCGGAATDLDHWLTGRWRAHTRILGQPATVPVEHEPWPLWDATLLGIEESLLAAAGLPPPTEPPLVHSLARRLRRPAGRAAPPLVAASSGPTCPTRVPPGARVGRAGRVLWPVLDCTRARRERASLVQTVSRAFRAAGGRVEPPRAG